MGKTDTKQQALSSMGYFFLRMAFGKESFAGDRGGNPGRSLPE